MLRSDVQAILHRLDGMFRVKAGRGWINWLLKVSYSLRGGMTAGVARSAVVCIRAFYQIYKHQGVPGLVHRTKSMYVLTMQSVGKQKILSTQALGPAVSRTGSGLPRLIPREHRMRMRAGDVFYIRLWLSWFSIYRVLTFPGKIKLNTITDPGVYLSDSLIGEFEKIVPLFCAQFGFAKQSSAVQKIGQVSFPPLSRSTPSYRDSCRKMSGSPIGILSGAWSLCQNREVFASWCHLADVLDYKGPYAGLLWTKSILKVIASAQKSFGAVVALWNKDAKTPVITGAIGKLGLKDEPAGKVRVFAMVECWTQWLLRPLHLFLFTMLARLECDGTFDQLEPIHRLIELGKTRFYCYDLSAATDRLPISLQSRLLSHLFGESFGPHWAVLLIGRDYLLPIDNRLKDHPKSVRYAVGQPMGALSSWAMLALTHHCVVQWAAFRVGFQFGSFTDYAVLGDDIVIADGRVANSYLQLMESLGVQIGLHKSLVSRHGVLEFAKRFFVRGVDASPVPFKEMAAALCDFEYSTEFVRKYSLGKSSIAGFLGYGYRVRGRFAGLFSVLPRKLATLGMWRVSPWGILPHNVSSWLNINSYIIRPEWLVQVTEMWPELPPVATSRVIDAAKADEKRIDRVRDILPSADSSHSGSKWLTVWMEDKLWHLSKLWCETLFSKGSSHNEAYNTIWAIQHTQLLTSLSLLRSDMSKFSDVLFKITRHSRPTLPEHLFLKWMSVRLGVGQIRKPLLIGERITRAATPSPLFVSRLWQSLNNLPSIKPAFTAPKPKSKTRRSRRTLPKVVLL